MAPKLAKGAGKGKVAGKGKRVMYMKPLGFSYRVTFMQATAFIRRNRGHMEPSLLKKLREGGRYNQRQDRNQGTYIRVAEHIFLSPAATQDVYMGAMLRGGVRGAFLQQVIQTSGKMVERQKMLAPATTPRIIVIAPDNVLFAVR